MKYFTKENYTLMPWKNGGGVTTELYKDENFRLSLATVSQDGPFSLFPGLKRVLLILNGSGCMLEFEDRKITLDPQSEPFYFDGNLPIHCSLLGAAFQDFNVMFNSYWSHAFVSRIQSGDVTCITESLYVYNILTEELYWLTPDESLKIKDPSICVALSKIT